MIDKESYKKFALFVPLVTLLDTLILKDDAMAKLFLEMLPSYKKLELIYRGSRDEFKAAPFHQKVDNQGTHVVLLKSKEHNQIFGAWTDISMTSSNGQWKAGNGNTFLFKYTNTNQFHKLKCF